MKKALVLTLALALVLVSFSSFLGFKISDTLDDVSYKELYHKGDYEKLKGITLKTRASLDDRIIWNMETEMGEAPKTFTDVDFHVKRQFERYPERYDGVTTNTTAIFQNIREYKSENMKKIFPKAEKLFKSLTEEIKPGEEKTFDIKIKDAMDFYPFGNMSDLPYLWSLENIIFSLDYDRLKNDPASLDFLKFMDENFKIPVLETEKIELGIEKNTDGSLGGISIRHGNEDEYFPIDTYTSVADDGVYFTFDAHTSLGNTVDLSNLTLGYGIYKIPSSKKNGLDIENTELFYPLEEDVRILDLSCDDKNVILAYEKEELPFALSIGREDKKKNQDFLIYDKEAAYLDLDVQDHFIVVNLNLKTDREEDSWNIENKRIGVIDSENGKYYVPFMVMESDEGNNWYNYFADCEFDGERLIMSGNMRRDYERPDGLSYKTYDSSDIFIKIYEKEGITFYGEYQNSLTTGFSNEGQYRYQVHSFYPPANVIIEEQK